MRFDSVPREDVCVVIPCFNEAAHIRRVAAAARAFVRTVLVVDDGSSDATCSEATAGGAVVLKQVKNQGKGAALKAAYEWAAERGFTAAISLDGDGQHETSEIPLFIGAFDAGDCEIVIGNRMNDLRPMPRLRRWTNRFTSAVISRYVGQKLWDTQCGFRLVSMAAWKKVKVDGRRYEMESEILIRAARQGARIKQVPVKTIYFKSGESKINPVTDTVRFFRLLWRCRGVKTETGRLR